MTIVANAVRLPEEGRERMMESSIGVFNCFDPMNERARNDMPVLSEMMHYARTHAVPGKLKPGSWAEAIHDAAAAGEVPPEAVPVMMIDYMGPSLDTTIFGISSGVWLFAKHPDQWNLVRDDPSLIPAAINEILRMEAPIQGFSRYVACDYDLDGVSLPEGSRDRLLWCRQPRSPTVSRPRLLRRPARQCGASHGIRQRAAHLSWHEPRQARDAGVVQRVGAQDQALSHRAGRAHAEQHPARFQKIGCDRRVSGRPEVSGVRGDKRACGRLIREVIFHSEPLTLHLPNRDITIDPRRPKIDASIGIRPSFLHKSKPYVGPPCSGSPGHILKICATTGPPINEAGHTGPAVSVAGLACLRLPRRTVNCGAWLACARRFPNATISRKAALYRLGK
jgi:hypothetical protein